MSRREKVTEVKMMSAKQATILWEQFAGTGYGGDQGVCSTLLEYHLEGELPTIGGYNTNEDASTLATAIQFLRIWAGGLELKLSSLAKKAAKEAEKQKKQKAARKKAQEIEEEEEGEDDDK